MCVWANVWRDDVWWCDSFGVAVCISGEVCVKCQQGECKVHHEFMANVCPSRWPCLIHPAHSWQQVLPGCKRTPTQCIWISHTCPVSSVGHGCRNKTTGWKRRGVKWERGQDSWLSISLAFYFTGCQIHLPDVNFMFCVLTICTVQGDHKLHLGQSEKCLRQVLPRIFCLLQPLKFCFCVNLDSNAYMKL